jgi:hypothetical protein
MMLSAFILLYRITNLDPLGCERAVVPVDNNMYANKIQLPTLRALPSIKHTGRALWYFHIFLVGGKFFI